ncbi:hypothetical protein Vadar_024299 [Vaccinium darrowii]|uniref:Uncharacterized protein n=1 Tax=Vaccinium darrowii TaxID=229202 RepID=A0ACB7ZE01_9ERIC|nr:hypothetical protein Vadar_024299 [Vaccinium darrowii]
MAVGQTLALPKSILLCTPRNPVITSLSVNPNPSVHFFSFPSQTNSRRFSAVKFSLDYDNISSIDGNGHDGRQAVPQYPRPTEIPWQKEIANTVHLIGRVTTAVQVRYLPGGKTVAYCRIDVNKSPLTTSSVFLTFWETLAHIAFQHLEKGSRIYVCGRLLADVVESDDGKDLTYYKVNVKQLNFIEPFSSSDGDSNSAVSGSREELWQAFFANPADWWDNRKDKRDSKKHPRYPDFKHKHTGEVLWLTDKYIPPWVMSQLEILDAKREAFAFQGQNDGMNMNFGAGDNFSSL